MFAAPDAITLTGTIVSVDDDVATTNVDTC